MEEFFQVMPYVVLVGTVGGFLYWLIVIDTRGKDEPPDGDGCQGT